MCRSTSDPPPPTSRLSRTSTSPQSTPAIPTATPPCVTLTGESNGRVVSPADGRPHFGLSAVGELRRSEFGIEFGIMPIGIDRLALADKVAFELEMQFVQPPDGSSNSPPRP